MGGDRACHPGRGAAPCAHVPVDCAFDKARHRRNQGEGDENRLRGSPNRVGRMAVAGCEGERDG